MGEFGQDYIGLGVIILGGLGIHALEQWLAF